MNNISLGSRCRRINFTTAWFLLEYFDVRREISRALIELFYLWSLILTPRTLLSLDISINIVTLFISLIIRYNEGFENMQLYLDCILDDNQSKKYKVYYAFCFLHRETSKVALLEFVVSTENYSWSVKDILFVCIFSMLKIKSLNLTPKSVMGS